MSKEKGKKSGGIITFLFSVQGIVMHISAKMLLTIGSNLLQNIIHNDILQRTILKSRIRPQFLYASQSSRANHTE